jgi:hypothetical protein
LEGSSVEEDYDRKELLVLSLRPGEHAEAEAVLATNIEAAILRRE